MAVDLNVDLNVDQMERADHLVGTFESRFAEQVRFGIGEGIDPDILALDLLLAEPDPVVAQEVRVRLGVGAA